MSTGGARYIDDKTNQAISALRTELRPPWGAYSQPFRVTFPDMNVQREIVHGMNTIPDGFFVVYADADIVAEPGAIWTTTFAYLRGGAENARAIVIFYTLREDILDA